MTFLKDRESGEWYENNMCANRRMTLDVDELGIRVAAGFFAENENEEDKARYLIGWRCWLANYPYRLSTNFE